MKQNERFVRVSYGGEDHTVNVPAEFAKMLGKQFGDVKRWVEEQVAEVEQSHGPGVLTPRRLGKIVRARVLRVVPELLEDF